MSASYEESDWSSEYCSESSNDLSDDKTSKKAPKRKRELVGKGTRSTIIRPVVTSVPVNGQDNAKRLNISPDVLQRLLSIAKVAMNPGTEAEGRNAETVLSKYLTKHAVDRASFEKLIKPATEQDLLREAARFRILFHFSRRPAWVAWLLGAVSDLFGAGCYNAGSQVCFIYGEVDSANAAAELLADLYVSVSELCTTYNKRTPGLSLAATRQSYSRGLVTGFEKRCKRVLQQRREYVARVQLEASAREQAAKARAERRAEIAEKARLQRDLARQVLAAAEGEVKDVIAEPITLKYRMRVPPPDDDDDVPLFRKARPAPASPTESKQVHAPSSSSCRRTRCHALSSSSSDNDDDDGGNGADDSLDHAITAPPLRVGDTGEGPCSDSEDVECVAEEKLESVLRREREIAEREGRVVDLTLGADDDAAAPGGSSGGSGSGGALTVRDAQALALRLVRDVQVKEAVQATLKGLRRGRRSQPLKSFDQRAWRDGKEDSRRLSTGRAIT